MPSGLKNNIGSQTEGLKNIAKTNAKYDMEVRNQELLLGLQNGVYQQQGWNQRYGTSCHALNGKNFVHCVTGHLDL